LKKPSTALPPLSEEPIGPGGNCGFCGQAYVWAVGAWWCSTLKCRQGQAEFAVQAVDKKTKEVRWLYVPTHVGVAYERSPAKNRMLGGAAGGAKSHILRWGMLRKAMTIPGYNGLIVRRTYGELEKSQLRRLAIDVPLLGGVYTPTKYMAEFPATGGMIEAGHLDDATALSRWLSTEYDEIACDEGSTFNPDHILELSTRARTSKPAVRKAGGAKFDVGTNPGGPAWAVLRDLFVTHEPDWEAFPNLKKRYTPEQWVYLKSLLDDNPYRDPEYEDSLAVLSEARYEQLRWGAEFVTDGQFFRQWRAELDGKPWHVVDRPLADLRNLEWFCSMDWGYNAPGVLLWWACLPDGHYHIAREWKFRETPAVDIQARFWQITKEELGLSGVRYVVCDPAMKQRTGAGRGESIFETLAKASGGRKRGMPMRPGDNDRANGWTRCHLLLRAAPDGGPWVTVSPECRYGVRSMPGLVQDKNDPEDLDTTKDDHWADALRYGAMSRPAPTRAAAPLPPPVGSWGWQRNAYHTPQTTGVFTS
jgi:hypothetical protein